MDLGYFEARLMLNVYSITWTFLQEFSMLGIHEYDMWRVP